MGCQFILSFGLLGDLSLSIISQNLKEMYVIIFIRPVLEYVTAYFVNYIVMPVNISYAFKF